MKEFGERNETKGSTAIGQLKKSPRNKEIRGKCLWK